jgi:hypothetical protein
MIYWYIYIRGNKRKTKKIVRLEGRGGQYDHFAFDMLGFFNLEDSISRLVVVKNA